MRIVIATLALGLAVVPFALSAAITLNDGDFSAWSFNATGTATVTREPAGGNPDARLNLTTVSGPGSSVIGTAIKSDASTTNTLASAYFSLSLDALAGSGSTGNGQEIYLLVEQAGSIYGRSVGTTGAPTNYQRLNFSGDLYAAQFVRLLGAGPATPNFAGGVATRFGFGGYNTNSGTVTQYYDNFQLDLVDLVTDPAVPLTCTNASSVTVPTVSGPFMDLVSEGRITNGAYGFANTYTFNTDNGILYRAVQGGNTILDAAPRRVFTQSDGSEVMLFEYTTLSFIGAGVIVTGHRAAAILATGNIYFDQCDLTVEAGGDPGGPGGRPNSAGTNAPAPLGGGGAIGTPDGYNAGDPPCCLGFLPTSGAGGGGFVSRGNAGFPAKPIARWGNTSVIGYHNRPGGAGGLAYTNFAVLRGGGGGGGNSTYSDGASGLGGGRGAGALLISTPGTIQITGSSNLRADGSRLRSDPDGQFRTFAGGGAGGYLVLNGGSGILNQGLISAVGGPGLKTAIGWGSAGDGSGGLIVLKSAAGVTNTGELRSYGGAGPGNVCTAGAVQPQAPFVVIIVRLLSPTWQSNQFTFTLPTVANILYQVERNDDLTTTNWVAFTNVVGTGLPASIAAPVPGVPQRFFRVISY